MKVKEPNHWLERKNNKIIKPSFSFLFLSFCQLNFEGLTLNSIIVIGNEQMSRQVNTERDNTASGSMINGVSVSPGKVEMSLK